MGCKIKLKRTSFLIPTNRNSRIRFGQEDSTSMKNRRSRDKQLINQAKTQKSKRVTSYKNISEK